MAGIVAVACAGLVAIGLTTTRVDDPTDVVVRQELPVTTWLAPAEPALLRVGFVPTGYWPAAPPGQIAEFGAERRQQSFLRTDGTGEITGQIIVVRGESDVAAAEAARLSNDYGGRSVRINGTDGFVFEASGDNAIAAWADGSYLFTVSATGLSEADVLRVAESVTVP